LNNNEGGELKSIKGFSLLDILIVVLFLVMVAAIFIPKRQSDLENKYRKESRDKMMIISTAMDKYFTTAGGKINPDSLAKVDTLAAKEAKDKNADKSEVKVSIARLYTDDFELLKPFLPKDFSPTSPPNQKEYKIVYKDSTYFVIYCPNGYGTVVNGQALWEDTK
jgi:Tfp pilus assembly protein PilE